ncbi:MAG: tRNA (adenosine(37)-N6)-threonylcarbamoyltransferase complex dimerization subunit type 1 TsaB [Chloroflexi bacterium]|nr:tRNA (adenosine(37)-N6)-threonylcarbamoyltransferase complex dimerization subunit type 1 TsaB [Chloroflexota bacterium]
MLLAIDTATNRAGVALRDAGGPRASIQWRTERNHTVELLPNIVTLLAQAGVTVSRLQAVAVAIGPGSYTGLRIGLSVAKGFCLAQGTALLGVPTLDISALAVPPADHRLCAVLQAGRGRLSAAFYRPAAGGWQATGGIWLGRANELADACADQPTFFAGEIEPADEQVLRERLGALAAFAPPSARARDPQVLARIAWERWQRGQTDQAAALVPNYGP